MSAKKRIVVICPGRGTYTKETLGYLRQYGRHAREFLRDIDERRRALNEPTITELDEELQFKPPLHTRGENASSLIYACAYADFLAINRDKFEIVAVTGNSMGWYLTLAMGGSLDWTGAFEVVNTMGSMMKTEIVGGQVMYPVVNENWVRDPKKIADIEAAVARASEREGVEIHPSIFLGGYLVFGANKAGVSALLKELPPYENYPFQLINHAAFHTPLLRDTAAKAFHSISESLFQAPKIPLIDGRGCIWQPFSTNTEDLYNYTLGHQVVEPYDYTRAISVALKEFAPDHLVLLGPGSSLGGATGQIMIENKWHGIESKEQFSKRQAENPFLIAMGRADQRGLIL